MPGEEEGDSRVWITPRTQDALSPDQREQAWLLLEAYRQQVSLWDADVPNDVERNRYRRLFRWQ